MRWKNFAMEIVSQRHLNNTSRQALHNWVKCAAEPAGVQGLGPAVSLPGRGQQTWPVFMTLQSHNCSGSRLSYRHAVLAAWSCHVAPHPPECPARRTAPSSWCAIGSAPNCWHLHCKEMEVRKQDRVAVGGTKGQQNDRNVSKNRAS